MSEEPDKAPEPPSAPDKPNEPDEAANKTKRWPWWLRSSLWFALGTIATTAVSVVAFFLVWDDHKNEGFFSYVFFVLFGAGLAALPAVPFAAWAGFRTKNVKQWKAFGFLLPLACGIIYPPFVIVILWSVFFSYEITTDSVIVSIIACFALVLSLAEFCARLQPPERRWYQYSLKSLLIFMLIAGVVFSWFGKNIRKAESQRAVVIWIEEMGGRITPRNYFFSVKTIILSDPLVSDLFPLEGLTKLEFLWLKGSQISDLSSLEGLTSLEELHLFDTQVSNVSPLKGLTNLKSLSLKGTPLTDISPLKYLTNLEYLNLKKTQVTKQEIQKLQNALPNCDISWDGK